MSDVGNGLIRLRAANTLEVRYTARKGRAAIQHVVFDTTPVAQVHQHAAVVTNSDIDRFRLPVDSYVLGWSVVVVAEGAIVTIEIRIDGDVRYRRERTYSGSGAGPRGEVYMQVLS